MRGMGLFSKVYFASEQHNLVEGVDFLLTFTNAASTPIFINKFNYSKGLPPKLYFLPSSPLHFFCSINIKPVDDFKEQFFIEELTTINNSIQKNLKYFEWRYLANNPDQYIILELSSGENINGYVILKERKIKGIKFALLMDLIVNNPNEVDLLIKETRKWASKNYYLGLIALENELYKNTLSSYLKINTGKKFNFLVKGTEIHRQEKLEHEKFNFFLGDLDFL